MSKKNLQLELGGKYVSDMFNGALFVHEGRLHKLRFCDDHQVHTLSTDLTNPRDWDERVLSVDVLHGFSKFQWPTLGYRQLSTDYGQAVVHITGTRSALRGMRPEHLHYEYPPIARRMSHLYRQWDLVSQPVAMAQLFNPRFTKFTEGLQQLLSGQTAMFAVNPHLMACVSIDRSADSAYDIYFRQKLVGSVDEAGTVNLFNKIVQRDSVRTALFG